LATDDAGTPAAMARIDRIASMDELGQVLDSAQQGHGVLALITGEAGIGKTTLALEVSDRAVAAGMNAHWSACSAQAEARSYWPWSQLIQGQLAGLPAEGLAPLLAAISPALTTLDPSLANHFGVEPTPGHTEDQFGLFQAVARFWNMAASSDRPLLLLIDDIQWADAPSVQLLAHLATALRRTPVALVASIRTGEPLTKVMSRSLVELDRCVPVMVALAGLPRTALAELVKANGVTPGAALVDLLVERTAGNPFFATELLRSLDQSVDEFIPVVALADTVPASLAHAVQRRVDLLGPSVRDLLAAAAVVGPSGDLAVLAATAEQDLDRTTELLDQAGDAGLAARDGTTGWRFIHTLVREVIYRSLSTVIRHSCHERALGALEQVAASAPQLAWHAQYLVELGEVPRAIDVLLAAGNEYLNRHAHGPAADCFARAVALGEAETQAQAGRLLLLASAYRVLGYTGPARTAFLAAAHAAGDDHQLLGLATLGFAELPAGPDGATGRATDGAVEQLEVALAALGAAETPMRARLLARLGVEFHPGGERARSRLVVEEAVAMARRVADPVAIVSTMDAQRGLRVPGQLSLAASLAESAEMVALALTTEDPRTQRVAHRARVLDLVIAADLTAADGELVELARITAELGDSPAEYWWILLWRAMRALLGGHHPAAEAFAAQAWEIAESIGRPAAEVNWLIQTVFVRREQGRLTEVGVAVDAYRAKTPYSATTDALAAFTAAELGRLDEAADALQRLAEQFEEIGQNRDWPGTWFQLARIAYLVQDRTAAAALYDAGQALAGQCVLVGLGAVCVGAADLALAWLADTLGDGVAARHWYASAEELNIRADARSWLAQTRLDHADLLARQAGVDELVESSRLTNLAADSAARIGLHPVLDAANRRPAAEPATAAAPTAGPHGPGGGPEAGREGGVFSRQGAVWELEYDGQSIRLPHAKGLTDLSYLLANPGQPMHVSELVSLQANGATTPSGADEVFDLRARQDIRQRLRDLETEVEEADANSDLGRAERARDERSELLATLMPALGLGGQARRLNDPMERARKTVSARIRSSIDRIRSGHPSLARHLERSVDTGLWCVYNSENSVAWRA
jgi:tetratricopeptide (TPR) repeat protein